MKKAELFYLTTYAAHFIYGYVKDHSNSDRGNPLLPYGLLFLISNIHDSTYYGCVTPVVEHWLEGVIAQWIHHEI